MATQDQFLLVDSESMVGVEGIEVVQGTIAPTGSVRRTWSAIVGSCVAIALLVCVLRHGAALEASSSLVPAVRSAPLPILLKEGALKNLTQLNGGTCANTCHGHDCNYWNGHGYSCVDLENTYGCDCNGCSRCTRSCRPDCHDRTCDFWGEHGYSCSILESDYGCNCQHCKCNGPAPGPAPSPTPPPSSGNCNNIKPTHHYPLPDTTYTRGLPHPMVAKPSGMTMCQVQQLQQDCIAKINEYRAGAPFSDGRTRDHGSLQPLNLAKTSFSKCMNEKALSDLLYADHKHQGCGHYSLSEDCGVSGISGHRAENSCCPRSCSSYSQCKRVLFGCLQQMWDEGQIVLDSGSIDWTLQTGHYWNMIGSAYNHAGCGFGFDTHGKMLSTQNFYP